MDGASHNEHILPLGLYLKIGITLLVLTGITVMVSQIPLGPFNLVVAMTIAVTKGTLVAMYFMHLRYANKFFATIFVLALLMLTIFVVFTMFDTLNRGDIDLIKARPYKNEAVIYQHDTTPGPVADSSKGQALPTPPKVDSSR